ncbi:triose-phosphate isomerase [Roseovarius sp. SYSU LYC5161]|jgi:triosephosphate isomerase|uniref:triose-phosphate isomerase n=1 Tax=Roseovarius halophilus (ex Wu et al. 2025) TaxID=3376060 RepID=UPI00399AD477
MRRKLAAGNWKMNGLAADLSELEKMAAAKPAPTVDTAICGPATLLHRMAALGWPVGGEDCHPAEKGAHTGDISAEMLADAGAAYVITGHSERRADHGETDAEVCAKTQAAWRAGLTAILCIGETEAQYRAGETQQVLRGQMAGSMPEGCTGANTVLAYEPVWAIGTGLTPTADEIGAVHNALRDALIDRFGTETGLAIRILYGGSVKPANAAEIFGVADVDGALVGGASMKADDFLPIVAALESAD